jgi:hypothetical protein
MRQPFPLPIFNCKLGRFVAERVLLGDKQTATSRVIKKGYDEIKG